MDAPMSDPGRETWFTETNFVDAVAIHPTMSTTVGGQLRSQATHAATLAAAQLFYANRGMQSGEFLELSIDPAFPLVPLGPPRHLSVASSDPLLEEGLPVRQKEPAGIWEWDSKQSKWAFLETAGSKFNQYFILGTPPFWSDAVEVLPSGSHLNQVLICPDFSPKYLRDQQLFQAVRALRLSGNERNSRIADRLTALYRDSLSEGESMLADSVKQFAEFFLTHGELKIPKITLTPDGTLRARWIIGDGNFIAVEFTGKPLVKFVAEVPRNRGLTAQYFSSEPIENVLPAARAIGFSFA
jgi:hypothetical protein